MLYEMEKPKDSDSDGLYETYELHISTDPNDSDSDDDGLSDEEEITAGVDPNDADSKTMV